MAIATPAPKLQVRFCANTKEAWSLLEDFNVRRDHWVVSDLRTKLEIQRHLLKGSQGLIGEPVLRATELWEQVLRRLEPGQRVVSSAAFRWMAEVLMESLESPLLSERPRLRGMALDLMEELHPVLEHPEAESILAEFFTEFPMTARRWEPLLKEVRRVRAAVVEQGILSRTLLPQSLLDREFDFSEHFQGRWFFDLGPSMTPAEAELLRRIAEVAEVVVLAPTPRWASEWSSVLRPFESFQSQLIWREVEDPPKRGVRRFTGRAAEIKDAVAQVRGWLDQGVIPDRIALFSTTLEEDLPALMAHLQSEGVPCEGAISLGKLHSLPEVQEGLARLRLSTRDPKFADLFSVGRRLSTASSERLQALFKNAISREDLDRDAVLAKSVSHWQPSSSTLSFADFLQWGSRVWPRTALSLWESLVEEMAREIPLDWKASPAHWARWAETLAARVEIRRDQGEGIHLVSHRTHESGRWTHVYFLNAKATDPQRGLLSMKEWSFFHQRFGFLLAHPELSLEQFLFNWSLYQPREELVVGLPNTDWSGAPQSLDAGVLTWAEESPVQAPRETRWDQTQRNKAREPSLRETLGAEILPWKDLPKLSLSSIEKFRNCPFLFTAEKRLGFSDESEVDLTLDERQKGSLLHRAVEWMLDPRRAFKGTDSEFASLLEELKGEVPENAMWPALWPSFRSRLQRQLKRVWESLQHELGEFPQRKILGVEVSFECYFDPTQKTWSPEPTPGALVFRGKIDRVDGIGTGLVQGLADGGRLLIDYKSSVKASNAMAKWLDENTLQMGFYSWLVEQGLVSPEMRGPVLGAEYLSLKDPSDREGVRCSEGQGLLFEETLSKEPVSKSDFDLVLKEVKEAVEKTTQEIVRGTFAPAPREAKICDFCRRRDLCRWNPS